MGWPLQMRLRDAEAAVAAAAATDGLPAAVTALFPAPHRLIAFRQPSLPAELKAATAALVESNMRAVYDASGWSDENDAGAEGETLFLLLFEPPPPAQAAAEDAEASGAPEAGPQGGQAVDLVGFAEVEFSVESGEPALYLLELQLAKRAQRRGLGARLTAATVRPKPSYPDPGPSLRLTLVLLLRWQEELAWSRGLRRIVLTVQTANAAALAFYDRQGYGADACSPELCPDECEPQRLPDGSVGFAYRLLCKKRPAGREQDKGEEEDGAGRVAKRRKRASGGAAE